MDEGVPVPEMMAHVSHVLRYDGVATKDAAGAGTPQTAGPYD